MTERQRNELEKQINDYSYLVEKYESKGKYMLADNALSNMFALRACVEFLGYISVYDGNKEKNGIEYQSYILKENK